MHTELYDRLNLTPDATPEQIQSAFRRLAKTLHPDATGGESRAAFEKITEARDILMDEARRARYDATGETEGTTDPDLERRASVMGMLTGLLDSIVASQVSTAYADIAEMMTDAVESQIEKCRTDLRKVRRLEQRNKEIQERMKKKRQQSGAHDLMGVVQNARARDYALKVKEMERMIDHLGEVLIMVNDYDYDVDDMPYEAPAPVHGGPGTMKSFTINISGGVGGSHDGARFTDDVA